MQRTPRLPSRLQSPGLSLLGLLLLTVLSCSKTAGPFVALKVSGLPPETTKLRVTATYLDVPQTREIDVVAGTQEVPITLDFPADSFGTLKVTAEATDGSCALARKESSFELADNQLYDQGVVTLDPVPLTACSFKTFKLKVAISDPTGGSVLSSVPGIDCGATCEANFRPNTQVTLNAKVFLGYDIVSWSEPSCGTSVNCPLTLTADKTVTLTIAPCTGWCEESPPAVTTDLYSIWAADANTAYAVGASGVILKRDVTGWQQMTSNTGQPLYGVGGFQSALYAAGGAGTVLSFEGGRWVKITVPDGAKNETLRTASVDQAGYAFALGTKGTYLRRDPGAQAFVVDGADLKMKDILASDVKTGGLGALGGNRTFVTADSRVFEYSCFINRGEQNLSIGAINDVWMQDADTVYVVSATGAIRRGTRNGLLCTLGNWATQASNVTTALRSIHGTAANNIYIVGDNGVVLKSTNGTTWAPETVAKAGTKQLNGVYTVGTDVYVVGNNGLILHYRP